MMKKYVTSLRWYLVLSSVLFLSLGMLGYLFGGNFYSLWKGLQGYFGGFANFHPLVVFVLIFVNNSITSLLAILLGVTLGIVPLLVSAGNGFIIGLAGYYTLQKSSLTFFIMSILPHGLIELPMVLLSTAIGIGVGFETLKKLLGRKSAVKRKLVKGLKLYAFVILPLLLLAAFIEIFITPSILMAI